jgi:hypothetical protein
MEAASIRVPVYDLLDWLQFYGVHAQAGNWLAYLWTPHNEHRIVLSRALLALDVRWLGGHGTAFVLSGLLLLVAMAVAVSREILKSSLSIAWKLSAIALSILLLTPAHAVVTLGMPAASVYMQTSAFSLLALALLEEPAADKSRFSWLRRIAAITAACLSAFGVSPGLLIWPVMLWSAWRGKARGPWIATLGCIGGLFIALYLWNLPLHSVSGAVESFSLLQSFDYGIRFLGLPWSHLHALVWPGRGIGFAVLCLGGFALIAETFAPRPSNRLHSFGLGLVLFAFLVAGSAALARANVAEAREMPIRYGMFVILAQIGLLLWALDLLQRAWRRTPRPALQWLVVALVVIWLCQQVVAGRYAVIEAHRYNDAWSRFVTGAWTPDMEHYVYPDRQRAETGLANLRRMGLYRGP